MTAAAAGLVLLGAGGHAREVHALALAAGLGSRLVAFAEDDAPPGKRLRDLPVLSVAELERRGPASVRLCAAIGTPARRRLIERLTALGFTFETLWDPSARSGPGVEVGTGSMVMANAVLTTDVRIGDHVIVNVGCVVSHDARVGSFTTLSPGVRLNGGAAVGEGCFLGTGAVVLPRVRVGDGATVGAGACVTRDVAPGTTVAGVPAKVMRTD